MKKQFIVLMMTLFAFGLTIQTAEAKRFGGGKSFGFQKKVAPKNYGTSKKAQSSPQSNSNKPAAAPATAGAGAKQSGASKWLGPLAGLAAGGLLAAMLFGDGFENFAIMDFLLIALVLFVLFKLFASRRKSQQQHYAGHQPYQQEEPTPQQTHQARESQQPEAYSPDYSGSIIGSGLSEDALKVPEQPSWFDEAGFIENAKHHFIQVQKAWDASDVNEIRDYCSPELFAAIGAEMSGMKPGENVTVVDELNAEIADMAIDGDYFVVSVRFNGFIQESLEEDAHAFEEIWHIRRLASDSGDWQIAGIQQL